MKYQSHNQQGSGNYVLSKALVPLQKNERSKAPLEDSFVFHGKFGYDTKIVLENNFSERSLIFHLSNEIQRCCGEKDSKRSLEEIRITDADGKEDKSRLILMIDFLSVRDTTSILLWGLRFRSSQFERYSSEFTLSLTSAKGSWPRYQCLSFTDFSILLDTKGDISIKGLSRDTTVFRKEICNAAIKKPSTQPKKHKRKKVCKAELCSIQRSLFHNVPPYLAFTYSPNRMKKLSKQIQKVLQWRIFDVTPEIITTIVENSGLNVTNREKGWFATWEKHLKRQVFKRFKEHQKINHFPGTSHIGYKDKLWLNIVRMQEINGKQKFSFMPQTYILPRDMKWLRDAWFEGGGKASWIIKPVNASRGEGIRIVHRWSDIPKRGHIIVQRYIHHPFLINGTKFDLRLYALVTSFDPLRLYVYEEGLVRFASEKYSPSLKRLCQPYIHLTNYSINCNNLNYTINEDENVPQGHKWSLKCLWSYFRDIGIDDRKVWSSLVDVVLKTFISCEDPLDKLAKKYAKNKYSCYELFGFDIMLDSSLKPWLLEVNISPSLHTDSQLDLKIKSELLTDMFNLVGFHIPEVKLSPNAQMELYHMAGLSPGSILCFDKHLYTFNLTRDDRIKQVRFKNGITNCSSILSYLTPGDVRQLVQSEDELARSGRFIRIFPSTTSAPYLALFEDMKYYNLLLHAWEKKYHGDRRAGIMLLQAFCEQGLHLQTEEIVENLNRINQTAMQESYLRGQRMMFSICREIIIGNQESHSVYEWNVLSLPAITNGEKKAFGTEPQRGSFAYPLDTLFDMQKTNVILNS